MSVSDILEKHKVWIFGQYGKGVRCGTIARQIGLYNTQVVSFLLKCGVPMHPAKACEKNREVILEMNSRLCSLAQIAKAVGTKGSIVKSFLRKNGETRHFPVNVKGERCPKWKGGRHTEKDGYVEVYAPDHPHRKKHTPYVFEHRLVMEKHIGRYLDPKEVVHHRNKNKGDNRIENLELFSSNGLHLATELKGQCPKWTEDGKRRMGNRSRIYKPQKPRKKPEQTPFQ